MKKPLLLFSIKAAVILYFAACTSIDHYTAARSATPIVTKGTWKVNLYTDADHDKTNDFAGYTFTFNSSGIIKATKNGIAISGNWAEDNISNRITINLVTTDPSLKELNSSWNVGEIGNGQIDLKYTGGTESGKLNISML